MPTTRRAGPVTVREPPPPSSALALEKVIHDHIPSVTASLLSLLSVLAGPVSDSTLRTLCLRAQEGVKRMDLELRTIERGWDSVDKERWEVCRRDYRGVMKLVNEVYKAGQGRVPEWRGRGRTMGR